MISRKNKLILKKIVSLFSVVRGYNILMIILAQYLSAIFILTKENSISAVLLDRYLFILVLASSLSIAAGYIINNFYDSEKDLINRPRKLLLDRLVSQQTKLVGYFVLNFITVLVVSYISFKAVLFFSSYIFMIWFYSHKLKKHLFIGNMVAAILAVIPFFIVLVYYANFEKLVFYHGGFLFLMIIIREITKDLENVTGDLTLSYNTIPVVYGVLFTKRVITVLTLIAMVLLAVFTSKFDLGKMNYFFYACIPILLFYTVFLWFSTSKKTYVFLHNLLKFLIVLGVFSIILSKPSLILSRI